MCTTLDECGLGVAGEIVWEEVVIVGVVVVRKSFVHVTVFHTSRQTMLNIYVKK